MEKSKNTKKTIIQAAICIGLLCVIWGGYSFINKEIEKNTMRIYSDDFSWIYQIDSIRKNEEVFEVYGFAFELGMDAVAGKYELVLQDIDTKKYHFLDMRYTKRRDVNDYFQCEYDYLNSGFVATIEDSQLDLEKEYQVYLRLTTGEKAYRTGIYISNGELLYTNPAKFEPLDVEGTALEEIVENGVLRVYRPDYGMYVYQYKEKLYWIAELGYENDDLDALLVQYQISTTQTEKLPKERLKNGWEWDNISFNFIDKEVIEYKTEKYRVASKELPKEYSVKGIWTGNYSNRWVWRQDFRPYYQFE